ncbi:hypothetical protein ElyMa_003204700 [Elysia marginata]|uniref:Uncharacterized protein n=1 Tax=Elysia marginata TaxID=1093978 RepID=A0AAV4J028_9GAST|nr:hypothetical protein ElyMa_003204700 [Elysia marginata]
MVDSVLIAGENKKCKDDIDRFFFNFDHLSSQGGKNTIKSRLQQDVPHQLRKLMMTAPDMAVLSDVEDNIMGYIGGYLSRKLTPYLCNLCLSSITCSIDSAKKSHIFISAKNFITDDEGGLHAPSQALQKVLSVAEATFRDCASHALHISGIRNFLIRKILEATHHCRLICQSDYKCDLQFMIINLFVNIRLHHLTRCISLSVAGEAQKKPAAQIEAKFRHL